MTFFCRTHSYLSFTPVGDPDSTANIIVDIVMLVLEMTKALMKLGEMEQNHPVETNCGFQEPTLKYQPIAHC